MNVSCVSNPVAGVASQANDVLAGAIAPVLPALADVEPGCLVSIEVELPPGILSPDKVPAGDSHWLAVNEDRAAHGRGAVLRLDADAARGFRAACGAWRRLGQGAAVPFAFFTVPPGGGEPSLWVPRVLLRRRQGRETLMLTARRDAVPPHAVAAQWQAEAAALLAGQAGRVEPAAILSSRTTPEDAVWLERVDAAIAAIRTGRLGKLVLGRRRAVALSRPADAAALARALAATHRDCCVFAFPHAGGHVVGASPERVAAVRDGHVVSHALAGTVKRGATTAEDAAAARWLLESAKERREHAVVVDFILEHLATLCQGLEPVAAPAVMRLRRVRHLWTPIRGRLRDGVGLLEVVARLHPTPAVLGQPRAAAAAWLDRLGEHRDALYTGVAGWIDGHGDGDAAVVLRSAHVVGDRAVLWAGAGIMAESDPRAELAETDLKLATMLDVLEGR